VSLTLHLGVDVQPYVEAPSEGQKKATASTVTTGDVAEFLEAKYHVMEIFFEAHSEEIGEFITDSLAGTIEDLVTGASPDQDPFGEVGEKIKSLFTKFIDSKEMDKLGYPGVPTAASIKGVRSRFKKRLDPGRPSFQDSSLYEDSFMAWID